MRNLGKLVAFMCAMAFSPSVLSAEAGDLSTAASNKSWLAFRAAVLSPQLSNRLAKPVDHNAIAGADIELVQLGLGANAPKAGLLAPGASLPRGTTELARASVPLAPAVPAKLRPLGYEAEDLAVPVRSMERPGLW